MRFVALSLTLCLAACGGAPPPAKVAEGPTSRFREGDWITLRYSGLYTKQPVVVREQVKAKSGLQVRFEVKARRGVEEREWIQVVTDTKENRDNNVVDELYFVDHGTPRKLANKKNQDLAELWNWTYVVPESKPANVRTEKREVKIGGVTFTCDVVLGETRVLGRAAAFEKIECEEFLWRRGGTRFWDLSTNEELYRAEVVGFGRDA